MNSDENLKNSNVACHKDMPTGVGEVPASADRLLGISRVRTHQTACPTAILPLGQAARQGPLRHHQSLHETAHILTICSLPVLSRLDDRRRIVELIILMIPSLQLNSTVRVLHLLVQYCTLSAQLQSSMSSYNSSQREEYSKQEHGVKSMIIFST